MINFKTIQVNQAKNEDKEHFQVSLAKRNSRMRFQVHQAKTVKIKSRSRYVNNNVFSHIFEFSMKFQEFSYSKHGIYLRLK